jgi:hypothetical protein
VVTSVDQSLESLLTVSLERARQSVEQKRAEDSLVRYARSGGR